jgi:hypothetical protein
MKWTFESTQFEEHKLLDSDLIRLKPYGLSLNQDPARPILILKDDSGQHSLTVTLTPVETGVVVQQSNPGAMSSCHKPTELLLKSLNIKILKCVFVSLKDHHQYVRLYLDGHPTHGSLKMKAIEALSLCLYLDVPIFATAKYMAKSRVLNVEMGTVPEGLLASANLLTKTHEYLI